MPSSHTRALLFGLGLLVPLHAQAVPQPPHRPVAARQVPVRQVVAGQPNARQLNARQVDPFAGMVWPARQVLPVQTAASHLAGDLRTRADQLRAVLAGTEVAPGRAPLPVVPAIHLRPDQPREWAAVLVRHGVLADAQEAGTVVRGLCGDLSQDPGPARQAGCWLDLLAWAQDALVRGAALGERSQTPPRHREHWTAAEIAARKAREQTLAARLVPDVAAALAAGEAPVATVTEAWLAPGPQRWPMYQGLIAQLEHYRQLARQPAADLTDVPVAATFAYKVPALAGKWLRRLDPAARMHLAERLCVEGYCAAPRVTVQPLQPGGPAQPAMPQPPREWTLPGDRLTVHEASEAVRASGAPALDPELTAQLQAFQADHGLRVSGLVDGPTLAALKVPMDQRVRQLRLALQRIRDTGLPRTPHFLIANVPAFRLDEWRGAQVHESHAIQVGLAWERKHGRLVPGRRTPLLTAPVRDIVVDPAWFVPGSILAEVNEEFAKDPDYARRNGFHFRTDARGNKMLVMDPGRENLLGQVKLDFPNPHLVFAHDTTSKWRFLLPERLTSHGCVRVHAASALARGLLAYDQDVPWPQEKWDALRKKSDEKFIKLRKPLLMHIVYWTADAGPDGRAHFYRDAYKLDDADWAQFQRSVHARSTATVAQGR